MTDEHDFPTANGFEVCETDERPGEPLYPQDGKIANRNGDEVSVGDRLQVWHKDWADGHGETLVTGELLVIEVAPGDDEPDIFAIPADRHPQEVQSIYRISSDLGTITKGRINRRPRYDPEDGVFTVTATVGTYGATGKNITEARSLGRDRLWGESVDSL